MATKTTVETRSTENRADMTKPRPTGTSLYAMATKSFELSWQKTKAANKTRLYAHPGTRVASTGPAAFSSSASSTGVMTWVGMCMPQLKTDVYIISCCNNGNNNSAKRPRMKVNKGEWPTRPNSNDLRTATRAAFI